MPFTFLFCFLLGWLLNDGSAHEILQDFRQSDAFFALVIFQQSCYNARKSQGTSV